MAEFIEFTIIGVALGAVYAISGAGLVVTYATSGIFNFAHGAVGMFAAFLYWQFRWDWNFPAPLAIILVIFVICPILGMLIEAVIIRGLQNTLEITKMMVPIALLLFLSGAAFWIWGDSNAETLRRFFGNSAKVTLGDTNVSIHNLIIMGVAVVVAAALYLLLYKTRLGITMRGVVDNPELIQLNGAHPRRTSSISWAIGTMMAGLAGVLFASLLGGGISNLMLTFVVVNVYAAAILGRLRSVSLTFVGAIIIGLSVSYWDWWTDVGQKWRWLSGFRTSIPVVLLFIILLILPHERLRGAVVERVRERFKVPSMSKAALWGLIFVGVALAAVPITQRAPAVILSTGLAFGIIALSIVLLTGYAGEVNLAPLTFAGIGALVAMRFEVGPGDIAARESLSPWGLLLAAGVCALVGAIVALPALRLRGLYLGLATMAFAIFVSRLVFNQRSPLQLNIPWYGDGEDFEFNLSVGSLNLPRPNWFGIDFRGSAGNFRFMVFLAIVFAILGIAMVALRRSPYGRWLAAMKDSPAASATLGLNLLWLKVSVFALSAAIAGVGGALYVAQQQSSTEELFVIEASLPLVLLTVVAGIGYVSGALAGGILLGVFFPMLANVFGKLSEDYSSFEWLFTDVLENFFVFIGPAFAAVSLASSPGGFLNDMFANYRVLAQRRGLPVLGAWAVFQGLFYMWRVTEGIGNWTFILISLAVVLLLPAIAQFISKASSSEEGQPALPQSGESSQLGESSQPGESLPAELVGIDRPFTQKDIKELDKALQLPARFP